MDATLVMTLSFVSRPKRPMLASALRGIIPSGNRTSGAVGTGDDDLNEVGAGDVDLAQTSQ